MPLRGSKEPGRINVSLVLVKLSVLTQLHLTALELIAAWLYRRCPDAGSASLLRLLGHLDFGKPRALQRRSWPASRRAARLITFVMHDKQICPTGASYNAENVVSNARREQALEAQTVLIEHWESPVEQWCGEIGDGKTWKAALDCLLWARS